jgi:phthalate 4,5-dioxygenase
MIRDDIDLLWRVGPGTPMGSMLREYWAPVLRSAALVRDAAPRRVRLYGEDFVAFRDTNGKVGVLEEACPHRGASLVLGRNEECGLRCLYHGWKFDTSGRVLDTPNDPGRRLDRIPVRHVGVREAGGMVWLWTGEGTPPPFPNFVFNSLEEPTQIRPVMGIMKANWFQLMENLWDPLHGPLLHGPVNKEAWYGKGTGIENSSSPIYESFNTSPKRTSLPDVAQFDVDPTDYGFRLRTTYPYANIGGSDFRATVMPFWVFAAGSRLGFEDREDGDKATVGHVPIDDETTIFWQVVYNPTKPLGRVGNHVADSAMDPDNFVPENYDREHQWLQDRKAMADRSSYSGLGIGHKVMSVFLEDFAMCESMGPIVDRSKESLGPADRGVIRGRQLFAQALRGYMDGKGALGQHADLSRISMPDGPELEPFEPSGHAVEQSDVALSAG